ncbi:Late embryogenis abundant protein 2 [Linum perenne]
MSRSFSTAKLLSAALTKAINGRGFSSAAAAAQAGKGGVMVKKTGEVDSKKVFIPLQRVSWVPDPITGFYRPENVSEDVHNHDAAYERALHLKN